MKLVVDINVLVSGSLWRGNSSRLVDALLDGVATLCVSPAILAEFEEVIQREKFRKRIGERGQSAQEIISRFRAAALIVEGRAVPVLSTLRDPDDVHVLSCAVDASVDAIITVHGIFRRSQRHRRVAGCGGQRGENVSGNLKGFRGYRSFGMR
ncbi:MAG: putative toxin-antitoxin system toxin component, PIN family [Limisphaerales bacterium]